MIFAVGSIRIRSILLPGNGSRTVMPFTTRVVFGSKTWFRQIELLTGSTEGATVAQLPVRAALKSPARCAAGGMIATVLLVLAARRNCRKLKTKNLLSSPL